MSDPRVTVLISMHNAERDVGAALKSIFAQSWSDFECLVIDDGSTDGSVAIVEAFRDARLRLLRQRENLGLARCLNLGLREARGEFIARQDADDLSSPQRFAQQIAFLETNPGVPLVGGQARVIDTHGRGRGVRRLPTTAGAIRWLSLFDNPVVHTAAMFRTTVIREEFGGYDESFPCCQDYALWALLLERYPLANLPDPLVTVREHEASVSATRGAEARVMVRRVVRRLADDWFSAPALEDEEVDLLCRFRAHLTPQEVAPFHALEDRLWRAAVADEPDLAGDRETRRTRARIAARIGYNLLAHDRRLAIAEVRRALQRDPTVAIELPFGRLLGLFLLGGNAQRLHRRWLAARRLFSSVARAPCV